MKKFNLRSHGVLLSSRYRLRNYFQSTTGAYKYEVSELILTGLTAIKYYQIIVCVSLSIVKILRVALPQSLWVAMSSLYHSHTDIQL